MGSNPHTYPLSAIVGACCVHGPVLGGVEVPVSIYTWGLSSRSPQAGHRFSILCAQDWGPGPGDVWIPWKAHDPDLSG